MISIQKFILLLLACFFCNSICSQSFIEGKIIDQEDKLSLINAHILNKQSGNATISNNDGFFRITGRPTDTIEISYLGYESRKILAKSISKYRIIELSEQVSLMESIVVIAEDPYLYNLISTIRKKLQRDKKTSKAKAYLNIVSHCNDKPVEFVEAYYNGTIKQGSLEKLEYKNGKSFLSKNEFGTYYLNVDMSKALTMYSLLDKQSRFPSNPFQLSKRALKKNIALTLENKTDQEIKISFKARKDIEGYFSGTVWINHKTEEIIALELNSDETSDHVFRGIGRSVLDTIDYTLFYSYQKNETKNELNFLKLRYDAVLTSDSVRTLRTHAESIIHLFDYNTLFTAPQINVPSLITDYKRFTIPPKDGVVWPELVQLNQVKLTDAKDSLRAIIHRTGREFSDQILEQEPFFEHNYIPWSKENRIRLKKGIKKKTSGQRANYTTPLKSTVVDIDLLNLEAQIYLDVLQTKDGLIFDTNTLFDIYQSYNYLEETSGLNTYTNMYFDIVEIHRRKLVAKLNESTITEQEAINIHLQNNRALNTELIKFKRDCFAGRHYNLFKSWNAYILKELEIDNLATFDPTAKFPEASY